MTENTTPPAAQAEARTTVVGYVTSEERDEIRGLHERKNGLAELFRVVACMSREELDNNGLYERLVADMGQAASEFQQWWDRMGHQYGWESAPDGRWNINFDTCAITLHKQS
jgi:CXXX repeat modification system protein